MVLAFHLLKIASKLFSNSIVHLSVIVYSVVAIACNYSLHLGTRLACNQFVCMLLYMYHLIFGSFQLHVTADVQNIDRSYIACTEPHHVMTYNAVYQGPG